MTPHLCLFTDSLEPSGMGQHMLTLAAELRASYRISCVCPPTVAGRRFLEGAAALGCETLALMVRDGGPSWRQLCDWLRTRETAIFHGHAGIGWEGHDGIYAARAAEVPVVVRTEHLPYLLTAHEQQASHRRLVEQLDQLICVSEAARDSFLAVGIPEQRVRAVRNGIRPPPQVDNGRAIRRGLGFPAAARLVLTVGRFTAQKGHQTLVEALPAVLHVAPDTHLLWVGVGPLEDDLRARIRACGLSDRVHFLGQRGDVPALMAAADLFVLPSLFEGLPLVVLEAMAAGLPVVGTRVCGSAEAIVDGTTGRLVEAGDAVALAAAIAEVLGEPSLAARWGAAGKGRVAREFGASRMAAETAVIYREVLRDRAARPRAAQISGRAD